MRTSNNTKKASSSEFPRQRKTLIQEDESQDFKRSTVLRGEEDWTNGKDKNQSRNENQTASPLQDSGRNSTTANTAVSRSYDPSKNLKNPTFDIRETRQRDMLRALGNVGVVRLSDANKYFYSENIKRLENDGFIKRSTKVASGKMVSFYTLDERGKKYVRRYLVHGGLYRRNPAQLNHDLVLSEEYLKLKKEEQHNWMNDEAIKKYLEEKGGDFELIDGAYVDESGHIIGVEIITKNYSDEVAAGKIRTITEHFQGRVIRHA